MEPALYGETGWVPVLKILIVDKDEDLFLKFNSLLTHNVIAKV